MDVGKIRHARPIQLRPQIVLRAVDDDQVGPQREDPLDVRIEQRANAGQLLDCGRKAVVAADGDDAIAGAHREQHLGGRGDD